MTIPPPPLPRTKALLAACMMRPFSAARWLGIDNDHRVNTYLLGRYALAAAAEAVLRRSGAPRITLHVPDYICNEAFERIRTLPVDLYFYPIMENLAIDWEKLEGNVVARGAPAALLIVDYFGFPNDPAGAASFCRRYGMALIRDAAHVLRPTKGTMSADFIVFSTHKLLPVGNCALLVAKNELKDLLPVTPASRRFRGDTVRWLAKRVTQKIMMAVGIPWHRRWAEDSWKSIPRPQSEKTSADRYSQSLLAIEIERAPAIGERRRFNYRALAESLRDLSGIAPLFPSMPDDCYPYVLPLLVEAGAEPLSRALLRVGVPALQWPELPPEVLRQPGHETAKSLFARVLLLPVHQSLRPKQIETMSRSVKETVERLRSA